MNRVVPPLLAAAGIAFGVWQAIDCAAIRFAYVADYSYAITFFLTGLIGVCGLLLIVYWRTRWVGVGVFVAAVLSLATFWGGMWTLERMKRVAWQHEPPMISMGPNQTASVVIYFRRGVTHDQIGDFESSVLEENAEPRHSGRDFPAFVSVFLALAPTQANGHEGVALTFSQNAPKDQVSAYLAKLEADERVSHAFMNVAPSSIPAVPQYP